MCIEFKFNHPILKVAKEDIEVAKILMNCKIIYLPFGKQIVIGRSYPRKKLYILGKLYKQRMTENLIHNRKYDIFSTKRGLYSFDLHCINSEVEFGKINSLGNGVFKAIIPKGSKYYTDEEQFVSNKLKILCV